MILHIDGDAFFASCEIAQNERFRGKPVVAGADKGIALAVSYDAKKLGISRGMTIKDIKEQFPQVIVTTSHYDIYRIYSLRMFEIVRRFSNCVEEYSVDECFAEISDEDSAKIIAHSLQKELEHDLGMTFSIGVAPTKVLAKVASKWNKPNGCTVITKDKIPEFLATIPAGKIWGIGPSSSASLMKHNIKTALDLAQKSESWILEHLSKPYAEIWHELNGRSVIALHEGSQRSFKSIMKTATFYPASAEKNILLHHLCNNTERACIKLRKHSLIAKEVSFYLKSQEFRHYYTEFILPIATNIPTDIFPLIENNLSKIYEPHRIYRATGVILRNIRTPELLQHDLFGKSALFQENSKLFTVIDAINQSPLLSKIFLARSLKKKEKDNYKNKKQNLKKPFYFINIPSWGEAT